MSKWWKNRQRDGWAVLIVNLPFLIIAIGILILAVTMTL